MTSRGARIAAGALTDVQIDELTERLEALPASLEPLDTSMLDGFLCGVLVQPTPIDERRWWPFVLDAEGRAPARGVDVAPLRVLVLQRFRFLRQAIEGRQWFDPWVFEVDAEEEDADRSTAAAHPWVIGFVTALEVFPALMAIDADTLTESLALLYRFLAPDDLEDADDVLEEIDALPPLGGLDDAVENLVRATLLLADIAAAA